MGINIRTIKDIKPYFTNRLRQVYPEPEIGAITNIIIKTLFKVSRLQAMTMPEKAVPANLKKELSRICEELLSGKPLQYILGETSFYNCTIMVDRSTLIPRPETEELVDKIIKENKGKEPLILDVATGSGCIAIALSVNLPGAVIKAFDIAHDAVRKAEENALLNKASVDFFTADVFDHKLMFEPPFDIIVCNPPYVLEPEKDLMSVNVLDFEPHSALFVPEDDPLRYYSAVLKLASKALKAGGKIWFEINEKMGRDASNLVRSAGYEEVQVIKDINGKDRILKGIKNE